MMKKFLLTSKNIEKDSYLWNMIGSMLNAFQSVIFLMILTRTVSLENSGIFTIAYADANLFLFIGKYGMRYFQVSDTKKEYDFFSYRTSRWISTIAMLVVSIGYTVYASVIHDYSSTKMWVILWMCIFKLPDAFEDIYYGEYQRLGRLDVASKAWALRLGITTIVFALGLIVTHNLLLSLMIATCITFVLMIILLQITKSVMVSIPGESVQKEPYNSNGWKKLLGVCFPLFLGTFLSFYIGNAPKYAIDALMSDKIQACFGFIAMPVFVISLLTSMIYNPILHNLAIAWDEKKITDFRKEVRRQNLFIVAVTLVCLIGAYLIGIPVLSILYNTDLTNYKNELLIMLIGGGFLGATGWFNAVITIMRKQNWLLVGYILVSVLAFVATNSAVKKAGVLGASIFYTVLMALLTASFAVIYFVEIIKQK